MARVGIIGAGIAGLTAAVQLQRDGVDVRVLEATDRVGGMIGTEQQKGYRVERGPNSLRGTDGTLGAMIRELNLVDDILPANEAARRRYVVRNGTPKPLPTSPWSFLTTDLLSARGKLRILAEPFIRRSVDPDHESVATFARRRLGREVLDYAVDPFVGGIFAGDPERLSLPHAFERLADLEREHGSLFKGMLQSARRNRTDASDGPALPRGIFSFRDGLHTLPRAMADRLGDRVQLETPVTALRQDEDRWHVAARQPDGATRMHFFDAVICTVPLHRLTALDLDTGVDLGPLEAVPYPPVSVLALGFDQDDVAHPLDGFGMLVPSVEDDVDILGTLFSSTLFPGRAPDGRVLLTTFVGGMRRPDLGMQPTDVLQPIVHRDLERLLGVKGEPRFVRHIRWAQAIPQYAIGYNQVTATLDRLETENTGLFFAGNYRSGISVGDAMDSAASAASRAQTTLTPEALGVK